MRTLRLVLGIGAVLTLAIQTSSGDDLRLTVLHTNDVHSRFLETNKYSGSCSEKERTDKKCYGGFARLHYKVTEIRRTHPNVVYLSAGDYFQGTVWYTLNKWRVVSHFVNQLNHTAMAIGNHEFDDNVGGLIPFLQAATFPVVASNIDDRSEPGIQGKFQKSVIVEYGGRKVGIIGYTTVETKAISNPGSLKFEDEVEAVGREAKRLDADGVKIIIAVGHAGYDVDMKVAEAPHVDLVVGGHTNTFLYSGKAPDIEEPLAEYPTLVRQKNGRRVPVVQAYAYGKYLGYLNLTFDSEGELLSWSGNPILLDSSVPQDEGMNEELIEWSKNISESIQREVGKTRVFLEGSSTECRLRECNLGNLIADAMVHVNMKFADDIYWSDVSMAILNSGGIRSSIDETSRNGSITMEDVLTVIPFQNTIDLIQIRGKDLRQVFEFSVKDYDPTGIHIPGKFLQVSGIRVIYDVSKPNGERVKDVQVLCTACRVPRYVPLNDTTVYKVAIPTYMATGGDGYTVIKENLINHHIPGFLDTDTFLEYLEAQSPVVQGLDGRISFFDPSTTSKPLRCDSVNSGTLVVIPTKTAYVLLYLILLSLILV